LGKTRFNTVVNPMGIIFNPEVIANRIEAVLNNRFTEFSDLLYEDYHFSFNYSKVLSRSDAEKTLSAIIEAEEYTKNTLISAQVLFITLGTAWSYRHNRSKNLVTNCHKVNQSEFSKELSTVKAIVNSLTNALLTLKKVNPNIKVVFTVSPVRHWKDGALENSLSKAHLLSGVHEVCKTMGVEYFPAYEMMMDDLRDYRFYASDMLHPSPVAIDYIWNNFQKGFFTQNTHEKVKLAEKIYQLEAHLGGMNAHMISKREALQTQFDQL